MQLVRGIIANRASTHAAWSAYVPAVLFFGGVSLVFLLPGALMLFYKREVRLDLENREVIERQTYLGYVRTRRYPLESFKTIVLARRQITRRRAGSSIGSSMLAAPIRTSSSNSRPAAAKLSGSSRMTRKHRSATRQPAWPR